MLGSIYAMVAVALTLSIGVLQFLNFSIPGLFMIGGMAMWALVRSGMPWPLAAGPALIAGAVCLPRGGAFHLALDAQRSAFRSACELDGLSAAVRAPGGDLLGSGAAHLAGAVRDRRLARRRPRHQSAAARRPSLLDRADLGIAAGAGTHPSRPRLAHDRRGFRHRAAARRRYQPHCAGGVSDQRPVCCACRRDIRVELPPGSSVHGRSGRSQRHLGHDRRRHGQRLGLDRRRADHRSGGGDVDRLFRRRFRRHRSLRTAAAHLVHPSDRIVRRRNRGAGARMSGYLEGVLVLLAVNVVFAYGGFLPLAAGQLNLGLAGFAAIGAYASAYLSNVFKLSPLVAIPFAGFVAGAVALIVAVPVLRTRGIYLALATFALGQIVQAIILNLEVVGGAAGYPVAAFIRFPTIAAVAAIVVALVWLLFATRFGIAVTAVHDDEGASDLMGIDVRAFQIAAFALGSAIAGIGGGLYAHHFSFIEAQYFNISLSITIVLYVLLGGTQTVIGPLLGAAVFTLLPEVLRASANWRYVAFAAALIVIMALRPEGLVTGAQLRRLLGANRAEPGDPAGDLAQERAS